MSAIETLADGSRLCVGAEIVGTVPALLEDSDGLCSPVDVYRMSCGYSLDGYLLLERTKERADTMGWGTGRSGPCQVWTLPGAPWCVLIKE